MAKFESIDKRYFKERTKLSEKYGQRELWSVIDHWPLYCGVANLARYMAIADIFRESLSVPGHVAEVGSWRGATLLLMAKLLRIYDSQGSKLVHCFDSFEGLTEFTGKDKDSDKFEGWYKGSFEELIDLIELYELSDDIIIHKGLVEETLPSVLGTSKDLSFSLVYCDVDLYQPTQTILKYFHPRVVKGGVFVFDEWNTSEFPGEGLAVNEFLKEFGDCYEVESVRNARQPTLLVRKIKN